MNEALPLADAQRFIVQAQADRHRHAVIVSRYVIHWTLVGDRCWFISLSSHRESWGANQGSQCLPIPPDSSRPLQGVSAGERLSVRLLPTGPDTRFGPVSGVIGGQLMRSSMRRRASAARARPSAGARGPPPPAATTISASPARPGQLSCAVIRANRRRRGGLAQNPLNIF